MLFCCILNHGNKTYNSKDKIVKLGRALEFSFPILIRLWWLSLGVACFRLMVEFKPSVKDLADNKTEYSNWLFGNRQYQWGSGRYWRLRKAANLKPQHSSPGGSSTWLHASSPKEWWNDIQNHNCVLAPTFASVFFYTGKNIYMSQINSYINCET